MAGKSGKGNSGCAMVAVALMALGLVITVLRAVWGLLAVLAVASLVGAFVVRKKGASAGGAASGGGDSFYTQKCPNCGAQIRVSEYERNARCEYCDSSFAAERAPLERPVAEEGGSRGGLLADPFKALLALGAVLLALSLTGFAFSGSGGSSSGSASTSSGASASTSASVAASSQASGAVAPMPKAVPADEVTLKATTEFLEYSNKKTDPVGLVEPSDSSAKVTAEGEIDLSRVGEQEITYGVESGGRASEKTVAFTVRDTKAPVIELSDSNPSIDQGAGFDPAAFVASVEDPVDGAIGRVDGAPAAMGERAGLEQFYDAGWYTIDGSIDTSTPGTYSFMIEAADKHGNVATKELLATVKEVVQAEPEPAPEQSAPVHTYIANVNTGKFHVPSCRDVNKMNESNKLEITATRQEMIDWGYSPCGHCHP